MAGTIEFSLKYDVQNGKLQVKLLNATLLGISSCKKNLKPFAMVYALPDREVRKRACLQPVCQEEMTFDIVPKELSLARSRRIVQIFVYDVEKRVEAYLGVPVTFTAHKCLGRIHIPLNTIKAANGTAVFKEKLIKCEDISIKARNVCQILEFRENAKAFCMQLFSLSSTFEDLVEKYLIEPTFRHLLNQHEKSRAPVLYLIGRSGEGKSSLINGLANMHVAEVGFYEATTAVSKSYLIEFDGGTTWQVYDTRGLSETTTPDGATGDPVTNVKEEITEYKPDAIVYVVSARGIRNCINELNTLCQILTEVQQTLGEVPPVIAVLTQADLFGMRSEWPPEEYPHKQEQLKTLLDSTATRVMHATEYSHVVPSKPFYGYSLKGDKPVLYVVPVAVPIPEDGELWNIDTLSIVLGKKLPPEARYQFFHAEVPNNATDSSSSNRMPYTGNGRERGRQQYDRDCCSELIKYFTSAAVLIGALPIPGSDTIVLTILQIIMVSFIAFQSGRELSIRTAIEYMTAMGLTFIAGQGCLKTAQELIKLIPFAGWAVSGSLSGVGTYAMGKSAEKYFLDGETRDPREFENGSGQQQSGGQPGWHAPSSTT